MLAPPPGRGGAAFRSSADVEPPLVRGVAEAERPVRLLEVAAAVPDHAVAVEGGREEGGAVEVRVEPDPPGERSRRAAVERARERLDALALARAVAAVDPPREVDGRVPDEVA